MNLIIATTSEAEEHKSKSQCVHSYRSSLKLSLIVIDNWLENHDSQKTNQKTIRFKHENNPITLATFSWSDETHKLSLEKNVKQLSNSSEHLQVLYIG